MPTAVYEVVAQAARYWFVFLMGLIAWRSYSWYGHERADRKKRLELLPDAGYVGEFVILKEDNTQEIIALPWEGSIGADKNNDVCLPYEGVFDKHILFKYDRKKGLRVNPVRKCVFFVDGKEVSGRRKYAFMQDESLLFLGEVVVQLRLFEGFETNESIDIEIYFDP